MWGGRVGGGKRGGVWGGNQWGSPGGGQGAFDTGRSSFKARSQQGLEGRERGDTSRTEQEIAHTRIHHTQIDICVCISSAARQTMTPALERQEEEEGLNDPEY